MPNHNNNHSTLLQSLFFHTNKMGESSLSLEELMEVEEEEERADERAEERSRSSQDNNSLLGMWGDFLCHSFQSLTAQDVPTQERQVS